MRPPGPRTCPCPRGPCPRDQSEYLGFIEALVFTRGWNEQGAGGPPSPEYSFGRMGILGEILWGVALPLSPPQEAAHQELEPSM